MTLCLCLGVAAAVSAQSTREMEDTKEIILGPKKSSGGSSTSDRTPDRDVVLGDRRVYDKNGTTYPRRSTGSTRESQINQVNREYDAKIYSIRNNRYLSAAEKERAIRQLEADRARKVRQINDRYYGSNNKRYNDRRYDDKRYDRRYDDGDRYGKKKHKKYKKDNGKHLGWKKGKGNPHRRD